MSGRLEKAEVSLPILETSMILNTFNKGLSAKVTEIPQLGMGVGPHYSMVITATAQLFSKKFGRPLIIPVVEIKHTASVG